MAVMLSDGGNERLTLTPLSLDNDDNLWIRSYLSFVSPAQKFECVGSFLTRGDVDELLAMLNIVSATQETHIAFRATEPDFELQFELAGNGTYAITASYCEPGGTPNNHRLLRLSVSVSRIQDFEEHLKLEISRIIKT